MNLFTRKSQKNIKKIKYLLLFLFPYELFMAHRIQWSSLRWILENLDIELWLLWAIQKKKAELFARVSGKNEFYNLIIELHMSLGNILKCHILNFRNKIFIHQVPNAWTSFLLVRLTEVSLHVFVSLHHLLLLQSHSYCWFCLRFIWISC